MPAAEEPKAGVCTEVLARGYSSLPFGFLKRAIWPLRSNQLPLAGASAQGHSRDFDGLPMTSGLPPEADIVTTGRHVSKVPKAAFHLMLLIVELRGERSSDGQRPRSRRTPGILIGAPRSLQ